MMNLAPHAQTPRDVDLQRTRQAFLFAREQLAANSCSSRYGSVPDMRHWAPEQKNGSQAANDVADGRLN